MDAHSKLLWESLSCVVPQPLLEIVDSYCWFREGANLDARLGSPEWGPWCRARVVSVDRKNERIDVRFLGLHRNRRRTLPTRTQTPRVPSHVRSFCSDWRSFSAGQRVWTTITTTHRDEQSRKCTVVRLDDFEAENLTLVLREADGSETRIRAEDDVAVLSAE